MSGKQDILLAFYGDDLTGSTDALEFICRAGAKAVLFLEPPAGEQLDNFAGLQAYGVAGLTRSLSAEKMEEQLLPAFQTMKQSGVRHVHYKVCSTFDSSPDIGSIGKAIDCGAAVFQNNFIPVLGGMPSLGRYCVFGNLFARMGIGSNGKIHRLDRHPSMSKHPVTPANESDLRLHLGRQTKKKIGLIDVVHLEKNMVQWNENIESDDEVILIDALTDGHLEKIGAWLDVQHKTDKPLFSVGSSGIEMALGCFWNSEGVLYKPASWQEIKPVSPLLVVSGSCSPVTASQIEYAKAKGFEAVIVDAGATCETGILEEGVHNKVAELLRSGKDVIVHTGTKSGANLPSEVLGKALGAIARQAVMETNLERVVIAGGDTSSYAARAMKIEALEMIAPLVPGAPLCRVYSKTTCINGIEVNLKGGQVGGEDYFVVLKEGRKRMIEPQ